MTEHEYRSLCSACDRSLSGPTVTLERVSIPWLHVIRGHPVFLQNYAEIFAEVATETWAARGRRILRRHWEKCKQLGRLLKTRSRPWYESDSLPAKVDVLMVSHLLQESHAGNADDFYFGTVPGVLTRQGYRVAIVLIDHANLDPAKIAASWQGSVVPRVILSNVAPLGPEIKLWRSMLRESVQLARESRRANGLHRKVLAWAAHEAVCGGAIRARRIGWQIEGLVRRLRPRVLVVTHEGHAWERAAFAAAKFAHPGVTCAGYQHAILFPLQHALYRRLGGPFDPDHVFTAGSVACRRIKELLGFERVGVSVLGSGRGFSAGTSAAIELQDGHVRTRSRHACLVLPEGIESECHLLFDFSLDCAVACPDIDFVWRLHPVVSFATLRKQSTRLGKLPPNVRLSTGSMEADMVACRWALYRGTTAVVQAVGAGLRPVYFERPAEMTIDPLYEMDGWKAIVRTAEEFKRVTETAQTSDHGVVTGASQEVVRLYCLELFSPFDPAVLKQLIDGVPGTFE